MTDEPTDAFDYEAGATIQGRGEVSSAQRDLAGMRLARCLAHLPGGPGRLLLLGCGAGRHVRAIRRERPDLTVHGSDLSLTGVREATRYRDGAHYTVADALALPYCDAAFDSVVLFDLLEHVPDVERALDEIARVLRPGGIFHGFVPCEAQPGTLFAWLWPAGPVPIHRWKRDHVGHIQQLTVAQVDGLCRARGLVPVARSYSFHLIGQCHDILDYWRRETVLHPRATAPLIMGFTRLAMPLTWRLTYLEAGLLHAWPAATGLHLTARRA
ncbi:MAG: class I SAM-dependent methyltransferase [Chloroflexi bacterium]|nr:class I SAM-dependent methyltransferase [Chloroflexota bacterium]